MKISFVIPCFNEADNINKLQNELFPVLSDLVGTCVIDKENQVESIQVIFVDDGSQDKTWDLLNERFGELDNPALSVQILKHAKNRGLGAALRTGFEVLEGELIVTTDSDGTYKFSTIPALIQMMRDGAEIVTASPYHPQGEVVGVPGYRVFLSRGSSLLYRILLNWNIHTYTALYRAYRREVIEKIHFAADDYLAGTEIMVKAMLLGYSVVEYPAALHRRMFGVSKARLIQTILSHLRFQFRLVMHRMGIHTMVQP